MLGEIGTGAGVNIYAGGPKENSMEMLNVKVAFEHAVQVDNPNKAPEASAVHRALRKVVEKLDRLHMSIHYACDALK